MQRPTFNAPQEPTRRDTIGLRSIVHYDPMAPRATTSVMVGKYVVARRPLADSVHTLYMILDGTDVVGTSISHPNEDDCASAIKRNQRKKAESLAESTIAKAKKRKPRAIRVKEVA
ncbi:beta-hexosaminidase [Paraburkholderia madseniana]|uniref:beta-hexosaminidase n=1 Tax=Paraburkholderia madseniana TaxID=2599607 RepID=UPI0015C55DF6|nr:beta-hexosaminidase [Paraburkholderia madseniana]NPT63619.1 beta-hexosaminidase [Paraburkholderia madseniana]